MRTNYWPHPCWPSSAAVWPQQIPASAEGIHSSYSHHSCHPFSYLHLTHHHQRSCNKKMMEIMMIVMIMIRRRL